MLPQFNRKLPNHLGSPRKTIDNFRPKKSLNSKPTRFNLSLQKTTSQKTVYLPFSFSTKKKSRDYFDAVSIFRLTNGFNLFVFLFPLLISEIVWIFRFLEFKFCWFFIGSVQGLESRFLDFFWLFLHAFLAGTGSQ